MHNTTRGRTDGQTGRQTDRQVKFQLLSFVCAINIIMVGLSGHPYFRNGNLLWRFLHNYTKQLYHCR